MRKLTIHEKTFETLDPSWEMSEMKSATKEENVGASNVPSPALYYEYSPVEREKLKWGKEKKIYVERTNLYAKNIQCGVRELLKIDL